MNSILSRRSIRKFTSQPVEPSIIQELLQAGMAAPSAGNEQPWQFIVLTDKGVMEEITTVHPYSQMLKQAAFAIVVCGDTEKEIYKGFWVQDCSAATENILIAATEKGLGAVWLGVHPVDERVKGVSRVLKLPEHVIPLSIIPVGYPDEQKGPANRYNESRIRYNKW